jgi:hypothetical protein
VAIAGVKVRVASPPMEKAIPFYAVGLLVIIAGASTTGVHGLTAVALVVGGFVIFCLGIVVENRAGT